MQSKAVFVKTPQGPQAAGRIEERADGKTYIRRVREKNLFKQLDAWSFLAEGIQKARAEDCLYIEAQDREAGIIYRIGLSDFLKYGIKRNFGYGVQLLVPRKYFQKVYAGQGNLFSEVMA